MTLVLVAGALAILALGCIVPTEPEWAPDAAVNLPPYIVVDKADPPFEFEARPSYGLDDRPQFSVVVADADLNQQLTVRFCFRESLRAERFMLLQEVPAGVGGLTDVPAERVPLSVPLNVCGTFPLVSNVHFLYVVVTDGTFKSRLVDECEEVTDGSTSARAAWSFECTGT